jgi:hypothetical protein
MIFLLDFSIHLQLCNHIMFAYVFKSFMLCDVKTFVLNLL